VELPLLISITTLKKPAVTDQTQPYCAVKVLKSAAMEQPAQPITGVWVEVPDGNQTHPDETTSENGTL
jgi:hypothetical protein